MQSPLSAWLVKHGLVHRSLGFDYQGIETLQIKPEDWHSIAVISYVYGYNYLRSQCAYDVAPGGPLASVYHLTRIQYGVDQPEESLTKRARTALGKVVRSVKDTKRARTALGKVVRSVKDTKRLAFTTLLPQLRIA
ncbi:hypothetical protein NE237_013086 [Protea cynaroides]|uniref:Uncharacterized protein n=1 Tax=Protea cynaroides TaxID=273540 RepID=A0A9Q0H127_9MAGN|nr:hypothetical protein NE237_013086 [Protea cynaroides]